MQPLRKSEFRERTIKAAGRESARVTVRHAYRPVGILIVISFLTFTALLDHGASLPLATFVTILVSLLVIMFS